MHLILWVDIERVFNTEYETAVRGAAVHQTCVALRFEVTDVLVERDGVGVGLLEVEVGRVFDYFSELGTRHYLN
jgi:hypothetical protein